MNSSFLWLPLVEANQGGESKCPQADITGFDDIEPDRLPVILEEGQNPLESTYYVGKQTLKDNYFGQAPVVI